MFCRLKNSFECIQVEPAGFELYLFLRSQRGFQAFQIDDATNDATFI